MMMTATRVGMMTMRTARKKTRIKALIIRFSVRVRDKLGELDGWIHPISSPCILIIYKDFYTKVLILIYYITGRKDMIKEVKVSISIVIQFETLEELVV